MAAASSHLRLHLIRVDLHLLSFRVLALLSQRHLNFAQVEQLLGELGLALRLRLAPFPKVVVVKHMPLTHRLEQFRGALLVLLHLVVPRSVELLKINHVSLLHSQALDDLARPHALLPPLLLVLLQLLEALLRDCTRKTERAG